jgi:hypothetical protein
MNIDWIFTVDNWYYIFPILVGAVLSIVSIRSKFFYTRRYVFSLWEGWAYIFLSAIGSLLVTLILDYIGTEVIGHGFLNCILTSFLGAGIFLGIITKLPIAEPDYSAGEQLKTVRDFIYSFLDRSIEQKLRQLIQVELRNFEPGGSYSNGNYFTSNQGDQFLRRVKWLIKGSSLSRDEVNYYIAESDAYVEQGDYVSVILILTNYYDLDFLIKHFREFNASPSG